MRAIAKSKAWLSIVSGKYGSSECEAIQFKDLVVFAKQQNCLYKFFDAASDKTWVNLSTLKPFLCRACSSASLPLL